MVYRLEKTSWYVWGPVQEWREVGKGGKTYLSMVWVTFTIEKIRNNHVNLEQMSLAYNNHCICFPGKETACQCRRLRFDPQVGKIPLEKEILAWRISWTKEPGKLQSAGSKKCWTRLSNWTMRVLHIPVCLLSSVGTLWCPTAPPHFLALVSIAKSILGNTGNTGSLFLVFFTSACCLPSLYFLLMSQPFLPFLFPYSPWQAPRTLWLSSIPPLWNPVIGEDGEALQHDGETSEASQRATVARTWPLVNEMKCYCYTCRHLLAEGEVGSRDRVAHFCSFLFYFEIQSQQASGNFLCSSLAVLSLYLPGQSVGSGSSSVNFLNNWMNEWAGGSFPDLIASQ